MSWPVWHYDGKTATRHQSTFTQASSGFQLKDSSDPDTVYAWSSLQSYGARQGSDVYGHNSIEGWRVGFAGGVPAELKAKLPRVRRYGGVIDAIGFWPAAGGFLAASVAVVLLVVSAPAFLAPLVPMSWEKKLGDSMIGDFGGKICKGPGVQKVIADFQRRLDPKGPPLDISLVNVDMVNAVALPGGRILLFEGLLKEAAGPDEVAGVLGHEIGHVRNRDVAQALLRQFGLSVVIGGGNSGAVLNSLISSSYSREAEAAADQYAVALLRGANVSPDATAGFFGKLAKSEKEMGQGAAALGYLSSHPMSASREASFRGSKVSGKPYKPALSDAEWKTLLGGCENDPNVEEGGDFLI